MKKDVAAEAGVTPGYLGDLLAHRCGASPKNAEAISRALGVQIEVLFPEACGWVSPLPDRTNKLEETAA